LTKSTKKTTESAMIVLREKDRTREKRLSFAKASIFLLWVMFVFALFITLFFTINNETNNNNNSIRLLRQQQQHRTFNKALLFHATPSRKRTRTNHHQHVQGGYLPKKSTIYVDDKRLIHTGPNPLHN
jgi:heme/copper-type cytochrome/quinol oxidase subunit 3